MASHRASRPRQTRFWCAAALSAALAGCVAPIIVPDAQPQYRLQWNDEWTGLYQCPMGVQQPETVRIVQRGRYLVATKMTGDACVPAGFVTWEAALPRHAIYTYDLPLSLNASITVGAPGMQMGRAWGRLTIVTPDRIVIEGAGGVELSRGMAVQAPSVQAPPPQWQSPPPQAGTAPAGQYPPPPPPQWPSSPAPGGPGYVASPAGGSPPGGNVAAPAAADSSPNMSPPPSASAKTKCGVRGVDWKNFKYPKSPRIGEAFTLKGGQADVAVETGLPDADPDLGYSLTLRSAEYLESGKATVAFVTIDASWTGPGNAGVDGVQVFVFKSSADCKTQPLGNIDAAGKLIGDAYVVDEGTERTEWRIVNGKLGKGKVTKKK
jgi:hypothetical protein